MSKRDESLSAIRVDSGGELPECTDYLTLDGICMQESRSKVTIISIMTQQTDKADELSVYDKI